MILFIPVPLIGNTDVMLGFLSTMLCSVSTIAITVYFLMQKGGARQIASIPFVAVLAAWVVIALITGIVEKNYIGDFAFVAFVFIVIFAMLAYTVMSPLLARRIMQLFSLLSLPAFVIAAVQRFCFPKLVAGGRSVSVFFNANYYGIIAEFIILVCVYCLCTFKKHRWLYISSIAANVAGIALAECRSAFFATIAGIFMIFLCLRHFRKAIAMLCTAAVAGLVIKLFPSIVPRVDLFASTTKDRFSIWSVAWNDFLKHPLFGRGFMSFKIASEGTGHLNLYHAHNVLLNPLENYGVTGFVLLAVFGIRSIKGCISALRSRRECALVLGIAFAILIHGITDDAILGAQSGLMTAMLFSLGGADVKNSCNR